MIKNIFVLIALTFSFLNAGDGSKKVVFDFTSGDIKVFEKKVLSGIANFKIHYESKLEELDVAVVIHGDAYKFFVKDLNASPYKDDKTLQSMQADLAKRLKSISELYDAEFLMCAHGIRKLKISPDNLYKFVQLVPNSTTGLIDKQSEGYAYIPIAQ